MEPVDPDRFVACLWAQDAGAVVRAAEQHRCSLRDALAPADYLESLRRYAELPETVERLAAAGFMKGVAGESTVDITSLQAAAPAQEGSAA